MKSVLLPSSMTFGGLFNNMAYSAEESSPIPYSTESCCICDEEFSSDSDLANHLVTHADEEVFKAGLLELEKKTPTKHPPPHSSTPVISRTVSLKEPLKRTASQRSKSPEVWEIISDDSDDESNKNKKSAKLSNSFRLVSTPSKSAENTPVQNNQSNKLSANQSNKPPGNQTNKPSGNQTNKPAGSQTNKPAGNQTIKPSVNQTVKPPGHKSHKLPVNQSDKNPLNQIKKLSAVNKTNGPPGNESNRAVNINPSNKPQSHKLSQVAQTYKCHTCSAEFKNINLLKEHVLTHENKESYTCHICKKAFLHKGSLRQHLHLHIGDKSHSCKVCNKKFTVKSVLRKHELEEHMQPASQTVQTKRQKST
ncbi:B-cell CLL/lymphoma 6 member B protein isoform X2 [Parasteatoda tepidariorum]|nr:zinc finger protein 600 isoform X2 [Parasteatoda tepidariorum]